MKPFIYLFIINITLPLSIYVQEKVSTDSVSNDTALIKEDTVEIQTVSVEALQKQIEELKTKVKILSESETRLKGKEYDDEQKIKDMELRIKRMENKLIFADSIIARLSNDCLRKKYDSIKVDNAIRNFDQMHSPELKNKFIRLRELLSDYGTYTLELQAILSEAQNDKALGNLFTGQKRALTYIEKIKGTRYYREAYNANWTIPYLNKIIDKSIETIKTFNPQKSKEINLLELLK